MYSVSQIDSQQRDRFLTTHDTPLGTILLATAAWAQSTVNPSDAEAVCRPQVMHAGVPPMVVAVPMTGTGQVRKGRRGDAQPKSAVIDHPDGVVPSEGGGQKVSNPALATSKTWQLEREFVQAFLVKYVYGGIEGNRSRRSR